MCPGGGARGFNLGLIKCWGVSLAHLVERIPYTRQTWGRFPAWVISPVSFPSLSHPVFCLLSYQKKKIFKINKVGTNPYNASPMCIYLLTLLTVIVDATFAV